MDFSNAFKSTTKLKKKKKAPIVVEEDYADLNDALNRDLEDEILQNEASAEIIEIPRNLTVTQEQMAARKVMDQRRWFCLARPQYPKSCGISSLVSCWNFLFSSLGAGKHRPISTEEALEVLGFKPPYQDVTFGSFTGNDTLLLWFNLLNKFFGVKGEARISFKLNG